MSSAEFIPSALFDKTKEKDWAANLGMMDWDSTRVVFTKRSLIEFLKSIDITVDPHFANIQKLPRYAEFGKLVQAAEEGANPTSTQGAIKQSTSGRIFAVEEEDDALATAPPRPSEASATVAPAATEKSPPAEPEEEVGFKFPSQPKPSRRVRTAPGGTDSISGLWDSGEQEGFKPTRKVRQRPGGEDHIGSMF